MSSPPPQTNYSLAEYEVDDPELAEIVKSMLDLDTGWPWPLDAVQGFFENMWNAIVNLPGTIFNFLKSKITELANWIWDNIAYPLILFTYDVWEETEEWTRGWPEPWRTLGRVLLFPSAFAAKGVRDVVIPAITNALGGIQDAISSALSGIGDAIANALKPIVDPILSAFDSIKRFFTEDVPNFFAEVGNAIKGAWDFIQSIPDRVRGFFTEFLPTWFKDRLHDLWEFISKEIGPRVEGFIKMVWEGIQGALKGLVNAIVGWARGTKESIEKGDIAGVLINMLPVLAASAAVAIALDVASIKIVGTGLDLSALKKVVLNAFDFKELTSVFFGVLGALMIEKPLTYVLNAQLRPVIPTPADLIKFYQLNVIDRKELYEYLAKHGFADKWLDAYEYSAWSVPRFDQVFVAYKRKKISHKDYLKWLDILNIRRMSRPGVTTPDVVIFEESMYRMPSAFHLVYAADTGVLALDDIKKILEWSLIHPDIVDLMARAFYERALLDEKRTAIKSVLQDYANGYISREEAKEALRALGKRGEDAEILLSAYDRMRGYLIRRNAVGEYEKMYRYGYINESEFVSQLKNLGLTSDYISELLSLLKDVRENYEVPKEARDERNALANTLLKMLRKGILREDEVRAALLKLRFSAQEVELKLRKAKQEYSEEIRELWEKYYTELFRRGLIDGNAYEDALVSLGFSHEYARAARNYYEAKFNHIDRQDITKDERTALANTLYSLYKKGAITDDELATRLAELGFSDEEINLRLERARREYQEEIREIQLDYLKELIKQGMISKAEFVNECNSLGYDRRKCSELADLYWARYVGLDFYVLTKDERSSLANTYAKLYYYGFMSEEELRNKLKALGFNDREIDLRVERAKAEDFLRYVEDVIKYYDNLLKEGKISVDQYVQALTSLGMRRERAEARAARYVKIAS